jgi:hypothetical protein
VALGSCSFPVQGLALAVVVTVVTRACWPSNVIKPPTTHSSVETPDNTNPLFERDRDARSFRLDQCQVEAAVARERDGIRRDEPRQRADQV